jgi:hypothetical protein
LKSGIAEMEISEDNDVHPAALHIKSEESKFPRLAEVAVTRIDLITLPIRSCVFIILVWSAYSLGYGNPLEEWRRESPESGVVARYTRNGRPWRIFYDRNRDRQWDMWIDERGGPPLIVSVDDNGDGRPDRDEDEFGQPLSGWRTSGWRAMKTAIEFLNNPRQLQYVGIAVMIYTLLELGVRTLRF